MAESATVRAADARFDQRRRERLGSATLRALGHSTAAEYRHRELQVDGAPMALGTPYLLVDLATVSDAVARGVVDGLAVRLRYGDRVAYDRYQPAALLERAVYDLAEQFRCEALLPPSLPGADHNIERAFLAWCRSEEATEFAATAIGTLLYTVMHMMRSRVVRQLADEQIETQIEETRSRIAPTLGTPLRALRPAVGDADLFLRHAADLAAAVGALASMDEGRGDESAQTVLDIFLPTGWEHDDTSATGALPAPSIGDLEGDVVDDLDHLGGYHPFTTAYDERTTGTALYSAERRRQLRMQLDRLRSAQAVSVGRLAQQIQRRLALQAHDGWNAAAEEGVLDGARLAQLVADPTNHRVFRSERRQPTAPLCVTFLLDNSGSMKRQRFASLAVLVDTMSRALDLAGATSEILGFTTAAWNGGRALRDWRAAGEPPQPRRIGETLHIVYKDADTPWRRARSGIAGLLATQHYREGIDGEALIWAYQRLLLRPEPQRVIVLVSDGAPMDAATLHANGDRYLPSHLRRVARFIEHDPTVRIRGLSLDIAVDATFTHEAVVDLDGTLTLGTYHDVIELLA